VMTQLASIKRLIVDNPGQVKRLEGIEALVNAKLTELKRAIEARRNQGLEAARALMAAEQDAALTDQLRRAMMAAEGEEMRLLHDRSAERDASLRRTRQQFLAGGVLSAVLLGTVFLFLFQENRRRLRAQAELRRHRDDLQRTVAARTAELSQVNDSLRRQREWLHVTLNSIGDAVLAADITGNITFLNPIAEELTGWKESEALGQPVREVFRIINEDTRAPSEDILERVLRQGDVMALANHTALLARDGREIPIEDSAAPIKDAADKVSGVVLVFHDVTEKRRAQQGMRESQRQNEFLASVVERAAQAFAVGYPDGRMGLINRAFEELTGYTADELRGMDWATTLTPPEWRGMERQKLEELHLTGQSVRYEKEYLRKDGSRVPIELLVHLVRNADGKPEYYYSFLTDISQRKRAEEDMQQTAATLQAANTSLQESRRAALNMMEDAIEARRQADATSEALRESRERLASFAAASFEGIVLSDQGRIIDCNEQFAQMVGRTAPQVIGTAIQDYVPPEDLERVAENIRSGRDSVTEHQMVRLDGSRITVEAHGRPSQGPGSTLRHTAMRDITERKQREALLEKLNRTLQALKDSSQAMMRATSEAGYLGEVCKIVVQVCGHAMVWVGFAEEDEAKTVRPVASAGFEAGYLDTLRISWAETERGQGPTGTAIRTGKPSHCRKMLTDPAFAPWRAEAVRRGYASSLVVPLLEAGKAFGAVTIYSQEPDVFSPDEERLLVQLADDVSYCLRTLRLRAAKAEADAQREIAQEALRQANAELEERVAARTADLHAAARYTRNLLEASLDPLVTISPQGKITDVNEATETVTGFARDRLIGSDFSSYFTEPDKAAASYQRVLIEGFVRDYPLTIRAVSGRTTDVLYNATVYRDDAGQVRGVFAAARDITDRKQAERRREFTTSLLALFAQKHTSGDYLKAVVDVIHRWTHCQAVGIRMADEQGEIPFAAWTGYEPEFIELENRLSLHRDNCCCIRAISQAFEAPDQGVLTSGGSYHCDDAIGFVNALPPEKRAHYRGNCMKFGFASLAIIPIRYREEVVGAIHLADRQKGRFPAAQVEFLETMTPLIGEAMHRFRTEAELARHRDQLEVLVGQRTQQLTDANVRLQHTAEDLKRSNRDLEQFAYVASHDLQEPLRAVGGYVKLLQHRFPEKLDEKARGYIAGAFDGATRMEQLIADLLAFSRVATRGNPFQLSNLGDALGQALTNLEVGIEAAGATITHDPMPTLSVDAGQIRQLFQNLIGNAIKFCRERAPEVHVGAERTAGRWVFSVRDNGIGIDPQYYDRIFQIFQRLHTRKEFPGTGIGLAICKRIVERHGGTIWIDSRPGEGATFFFSIPDSKPNGEAQTSDVLPAKDAKEERSDGVME
jgi:PAS domain S-box-containing protein